MIDKRKVLIYNTHWIKPKRWRQPIQSIKCQWKKGASLRIIIRDGRWKE